MGMWRQERPMLEQTNDQITDTECDCNDQIGEASQVPIPEIAFWENVFIYSFVLKVIIS